MESRPSFFSQIGAGNSQMILLESMPQQNAVGAQDEDWTGIQSPPKRRTLQNRVNQRARRLRLANGSKAPNENSRVEQDGRRLPSPPNACSSNTSSTFSRIAMPNQKRLRESGGHGDRNSHHAHTSSSFSSESPPRICHTSTPSSTDPWDESRGCHENAIIQFEKWTRQASLDDPTSNNLFTLIHYNMYRAFVRNIHALHLTVAGTNDDGAISPFNTLNTELSHIPPSLQPTSIQRTILHHPWLDLFPIPRMRDNLIQAGSSFDEMKLCRDLVGRDHKTGELTGIAVWGEAWDPSNWEVTEAFSREWKWVLEGCTELFLSTNYWRSKRGEDVLTFQDVAEIDIPRF
ncbi:uncharacterized protein PAC_06091 [Phialocephala subalpina]|uniref:BZIP domain-containing protein n=1 Tax=Phialocephala subalpina TaxID=576137 RepID=A0A1L7WTW2_9HELO|nr:uncharacterized protein PAC_06091 [Phialocephala subalpina]